MSITDELREYVNQTPVPKSRVLMEARERFNAIADRIDAEHQKACDDAWDNGYEADYLGIEKWLTEHPQVMEHHGWIRLPKDADGEYIHVGDVLTDDAEFRSEGEVVRLMLEGEDWFVGFDRRAGWTEPSIHEWHHHHAPTVEEVLTEFGIDWEHESDCEDRAALLKEYASKLRLVEGEDA